jgi:hypothetical protein
MYHLFLQYVVSVNKHSGTTSHALLCLQELSGISAHNFVLTEIFRGHLARVFEPSELLAGVMNGDDIRAFEFTHSSNPSDDLFVWVYNRYKCSYGASRTMSYFTLIGMPRYVRLSRSLLSVSHVLERLLAAYEYVFHTRYYFPLLCMTLAHLFPPSACVPKSILDVHAIPLAMLSWFRLKSL